VDEAWLRALEADVTLDDIDSAPERVE